MLRGNIMDYETEILNLKNEIKKLNSHLTDYMQENQKIIESYNEQFNTLFTDYDLKSKGIVKYFQELSCELLSFFDNVCRKHNLNYWLDYGTLLGAYRHELFIPWDDDLDVGMMAKDFIHFSKVINREIKKHGLEKNIHFSPIKKLEKISSCHFINWNLHQTLENYYPIWIFSPMTTHVLKRLARKNIWPKE